MSLYFQIKEALQPATTGFAGRKIRTDCIEK